MAGEGRILASGGRLVGMGAPILFAVQHYWGYWRVSEEVVEVRPLRQELAVKYAGSPYTMARLGQMTARWEWN